jgi:hypothetical protein
MELNYVGDVVYEDDVTQIAADDLKEALSEAKEYLSRAREAESMARSCGRGWQDRIDAVQREIDELPDDDEG